MITLGLPACASSTAWRIGAIRFRASAVLPRTSNCTSAECRSRETSPACGWSTGETRFRTSGCPDSVCTRPATAATNSGRSTVAVFDWTSTLSRAGILKFAWSSICSARLDSPFAIAHGFICFGPIAPPSTTATSANVTQPNAAVFQWRALQRAARPARFDVSIVSAPFCSRDFLTAKLAAGQRR